MRGPEEFKRFEAEGWSARAGTYGELTGAITARLADPLLDAAGVVGGGRLLDVATGPGYVAERALARGASVVGIDLADGMLALTRERLSGAPALELRTGDAEELPFADSGFDAVAGGFVLNHLPRPERAAAEAARVLRPGGRVAFSVWERPERMLAFGIVGEAIEAAGVDRDGAIPPGGPDPYRFAEEAELRGLLEGAGLRAVEVRTVELRHRVAGVEELWRGFLGSSVRTAAVIAAAGERGRSRVRAELERIASRYADRSGGLELPVAATIGSGARP